MIKTQRLKILGLIHYYDVYELRILMDLFEQDQKYSLTVAETTFELKMKGDLALYTRLNFSSQLQ